MTRRIGRRAFVAGSVLGAAAAFVPRSARAAEGADSHIEVLVEEPLGRIAPEIYSHFVEHLGGVVYDGIWVGEGSKIANVNGVRKELLDHLKRINPAVIRYPGGCFADSYDWRDGVGPRASRPKRTNFWFEVLESNAFGTNEFNRFCSLVGGKPYLAANLRGLPASEFDSWVDYCNAPAGSTTLAERRATGEAGSKEPFGVRYWGVGNESWGCGGNFTPEEYAAEFRRFTAWVPRYGVDLALVASGPNSGELDWTRGFFERTREKGEGSFGAIHAWALHYYTWNLSAGATNDWDAGKRDGRKFDLQEWYELFREGDKMESLVRDTWAVMGEYDTRHRVKLAVDEWGAWYAPGSEVGKAYPLSQASTIRDAILSGLTLDTFNRHPDKVIMSNAAQLVNCLHSLFLASEDEFVATPTYHVFDMYAAHQGATGVRTNFSAPAVRYARNDKPATFWGLAGSASVDGKRLVVTAVNPHASEPRDVEIVVRGAKVASAKATVLSGSDIHAENTFDRPREVVPKDAEVAVRSGVATFRFPAASVAKIEITLG